MFIVVGIVSVALLIVLWGRGDRRTIPVRLLLGGIALGCAGVTAMFEAFGNGIYLADYPNDHPTQVFLNQVLLWLGLASVVGAILLVLISAVAAAKQDADRIRRRGR
jgi:ABC-type Fe3+-siderophore transport system permease subunit